MVRRATARHLIQDILDHNMVLLGFFAMVIITFFVPRNNLNASYFYNLFHVCIVSRRQKV